MKSSIVILILRSLTVVDLGLGGRGNAEKRGPLITSSTQPTEIRPLLKP